MLSPLTLFLCTLGQELDQAVQFPSSHVYGSRSECLLQTRISLIYYVFYPLRSAYALKDSPFHNYRTQSSMTHIPER